MAFASAFAAKFAATEFGTARAILNQSWFFGFMVMEKSKFVTRSLPIFGIIAAFSFPLVFPLNAQKRGAREPKTVQVQRMADAHRGFDRVEAMLLGRALESSVGLLPLHPTETREGGFFGPLAAGIDHQSGGNGAKRSAVGAATAAVGAPVTTAGSSLGRGRVLASVGLLPLHLTETTSSNSGDIVNPTQHPTDEQLLKHVQSVARNLLGDRVVDGITYDDVASEVFCYLCAHSESIDKTPVAAIAKRQAKQISIDHLRRQRRVDPRDPTDLTNNWPVEKITDPKTPLNILLAKEKEQQTRQRLEVFLEHTFSTDSVAARVRDAMFELAHEDLKYITNIDLAERTGLPITEIENANKRIRSQAKKLRQGKLRSGVIRIINIPFASVPTFLAEAA